MLVTVTSKSTPLCDETGTLAIEEYAPGQYRLGRWTGDNWAPSGAHEISRDQLMALADLGFGQTFWLPTQSQPIYRFTGDHGGVDFSENSRHSVGTLYFDARELRAAIEELVGTPAG